MARRFSVLPSVLIALLITMVGLPLVGGLIAFAYFSRDLLSAQDIGKAPLPQSTKIYDRDGKVLLFQFEEERRDLVRYEDVPKVLVDATVAAEDHTFFTNPGVDVLGIARAAFADLTHRGEGSGGASTITQQLVKLRLVGNEFSLSRKIREAILAIEVTRTYSKQQILELYFNQIYYGNQAYGVRAAAQTYFGKGDLKTLTLSEAALLAGLPQLPSILDPSKAENVERAKERRSYVLEQMHELGTITTEQETAANAEPIKTVGPPVATIKAPHFVYQVRNQLSAILGGDEGAVTRGGFKVTTSLDMRLQETAERRVKESVDRLAPGSNVHNAALVSLDSRSGEVLAYVGSVDYNERTDPRVQGQFDVAGIGLRQAGSAFKLFNYVTALKKGATAATVVVDARTDFGGGYRPENADLQYHGPLTMRQALRESRNVPAVKFLQRWAGIDETIATAQEMGITADFKAAGAGLSLTLGAVPVRLLDMTAGYATFANGGESVRPQLVMKIHEPGGRLIYHFEPEKRRVLTPEVAWLMTDILKDTTQPDRSYVFGNWTNIGRPAALKTGTTDNMKDVYSVGFTPQIVTGVWMGNSDGDPMSSRDLTSAMGPGQLWRDFMKAAHVGVDVQDWPRPPGIVQAAVAVAPGAFGGYGSGLLPSKTSPSTTNEWFVRGTAPTRVDDWTGEGCGRPQPSASPVSGGPAAGEARGGAFSMRIKEDGPEAWKRDRDAWVDQAMAGRHDYGRFPWSKVLMKEGPCPSPSASPSLSASPSV